MLPETKRFVGWREYQLSVPYMQLHYKLQLLRH
jgi:hypothetical protein